MNEQISFIYSEENSIFREISNDIECINKRMQDEISKNIFINRLIFSMTGDVENMYSVISQTDIGKKFIDKLKKRYMNVL